MAAQKAGGNFKITQEESEPARPSQPARPTPCVNQHRVFPLPLFQLPPARPIRLRESRRTQLRSNFNSLTLQLSNLASASLNSLAAGSTPSATSHFFTSFNSAGLHSHSSSSSRALQRHAAPLQPASSALTASTASRTPPPASPSKTRSQPASTYPFDVCCDDSNPSLTQRCLLLPSSSHQPPFHSSAPSPAQLRVTEQLYGTVRQFARNCRAWKQPPSFNGPEEVLGETNPPSRDPDARVGSAPLPVPSELNGTSTLRHLCAYVTTHVAQSTQRASSRNFPTHSRSDPLLHPGSSAETSIQRPRPPLARNRPPATPSQQPWSQPHPYAAPAKVVPIDASRIALPSELNALPLLSMLPPALASSYSDLKSLLRDPLEVAALDASDPLPDPKLGADRSQYVPLIRRLMIPQMVSFTGEPLAINGAFAVVKDPESDRLIIDAQPANRLFKDPPHVRLPNPSHFVQLSVPFGTKLITAKSDLSNFYHQFKLPLEWQPFFCLPRLSDAECAELGVPLSTPYPMCTTLPMGFSHAVVLAQAAHEHVLYSSGALDPADNILNLSSPLVDRCLHCIYIDDLILLGPRFEDVDVQFHAALKSYESSRLPESVKKRDPPSRTPRPLKGIGIIIDGHALTLSIAVQDRLELIRDTLSLLHAVTVSGRQLGRVLGSWTWCLMLRRPALSVLQESYRYVQCADRRPFTLWHTVRQELICLMALTPLLQTDMSAPFCPVAYATDASDLAGGVCQTPLTPELAAVLYPLSSRPAANLLPRPSSSSAPFDHPAELDELPELLKPELSPSGLHLLQSVQQARWSVVVSSPWRHPQHINTLELHAVLLALRHSLSHPHSVCRRIFLIVDSSVAFYALWKGRSSSGQLLPVLRQVAAHLLASATSLQPCWVPSEWNPADAPSRLVPLQSPLTVQPVRSPSPPAPSASAACVAHSAPNPPPDPP